MAQTPELPDVEIRGRQHDRAQGILTAEAIQFIVDLQHHFGPERQRLLESRVRRQAEFDVGAFPDFREDTSEIRGGKWKIAPAPGDLTDRRVEITGPVEAKMMINALNSGARVYMADFEDSLSPTWQNVTEGQRNLMDAAQGKLEYKSPDGKEYRLKERTATLVVRPRGWHLPESHMLLEGKPVSASFFDFGLYFFHNATALMARGTGPYYYLPKLETYEEARLWASVFEHSENALGLRRGTIRATILIETISAAFEMDEILYELRHHACGLNAGRWDYLFSIVKKFRRRTGFVFPDRGELTMTLPFMRAYTDLLVETCHKRGAHAIGGMAAFVPSRKDPEVNTVAVAKVREDKLRESRDGFDGTWVAHPDLVPVAMEVFDSRLGDRPHQIDITRASDGVSAAELLDFRVPDGRITEAGLRTNVEIALRYVEAWLNGAGASAIHNLMEDAATAEICRSQVWQWVNQTATLDDGRNVTAPLVQEIMRRELANLIAEAKTIGREHRFKEAAAVFEETALAVEFTEFLTLPAYRWLE